jgi:hypothetical protein
MANEITATSWPRNTVKTVETRKRDIVIRITDWSRDRDEPAFDVEVYDHGVYDWNQSKTFSTKGGKRAAKVQAAQFAADKIASLLGVSPAREA